MKHVTARGKTLNMSALAASHQQDRAVSNVPINAKGDIIDSRGNVKIKREDIKQAMYDSQELPTENKVGIKEDEEVPETIVDTMPEDLVVVSKLERTHPNGMPYWEVEWSDGSMTEEDI